MVKPNLHAYPVPDHVLAAAARNAQHVPVSHRKLQPMWWPHFVLLPYSSGARWRVFWRTRHPHGRHCGGAWINFTAEQAPFMSRCSAPAKAAHTFCSWLNTQRNQHGHAAIAADHND